MLVILRLLVSNPQEICDCRRQSRSAWELADSETSSTSHGSFARGGWTRLARESSTRLESMRAERYPYDVIWTNGCYYRSNRKRSLTLYASVMRAYVCVYAHTCVHICTHVHMRVYVHVCACTRMRSCICVRSVRTCAHVRHVRAQCARYMRVARFSSSFEQKFARFPRIENEFFVFSIHAPSEHGIAIRIVEVRSD